MPLLQEKNRCSHPFPPRRRPPLLSLSLYPRASLPLTPTPPQRVHPPSANALPTYEGSTARVIRRIEDYGTNAIEVASVGSLPDMVG
ncbi:UNVERIFIED_CONTAM: hypothetical protein Slati_2129000 [Sesamum latifolium]|uniref:Uncharacterized protein n=1 Tax=Sesamum latifolium TaxID=2727402 RepID=A0AAW2WRN7_9LAMI